MRDDASSPPAFTLVEVLLSTAVLSLLVIILVSITNQTAATWRYTTSKVEQFSGARDAFESLTRQIGQATLNTRYDYFNSSGEARTQDNAANFVPKNYGRQSDLRFISGSMDRANRFDGQPASPLAADAGRPRPTHGVFFHAPLGFVDDTAKYGALPGLPTPGAITWNSTTTNAVVRHSSPMDRAGRRCATATVSWSSCAPLRKW